MSTTAVPTQGFSVPSIPQVPADAVTSQSRTPNPANPQEGAQAPQVPAQAPQQVPTAPAQPYTPASQQATQQQTRPLTATEIAALKLAGVTPPTQEQSQTPATRVPRVPQVPQTPQAPQAQEQRPTGGLNDYDVAGIENAELKGLAELLTLSAPTLDVERALGTAIAEGNPAYIDRAYLNEKFGDQAGKLIGLAEKIVNVAATEASTTVQNIYAAAGGEANWNAAVGAFNDRAPDYLKYAAKQLLDSTSTSKIMQGAKLVSDFAIQNGFVSQGGGTSVVPQGGNPGAQGLSKAAFQEAHAKLDKNAKDYMEQRNMLFYRRQIGKNRGL